MSDTSAPGATHEPAEVVVIDAPESSRYEARVADVVVGFARYRLTPDTITFLHTEVLPGSEGRGIGSRLAEAALRDARVRGLRVRPLCPFFAAYIQRHAEHADLVATSSPVPGPPSSA